MNWKTRMLGLALGAALAVPTAAFARDRGHDHGRQHRNERNWSHYDHRRLPPPPVGQRGRYEWRTVSTWVDGRWAEQYVPGRCVTNRRGNQKCWAGHTERRWVPAHYEDLAQWVWVPFSFRFGVQFGNG